MVVSEDIVFVDLLAHVIGFCFGGAAVGEGVVAARLFMCSCGRACDGNVTVCREDGAVQRADDGNVTCRGFEV
jgi:hypothetical protein